MARAATAATKKKSNVIKVNFKGVETTGVIPDGEYIAAITSVKQEESDEGNPYLAWMLKVVGGKYAGRTLYHNTSLQTQALWSTKRFLECLGLEVPDEELDLDLDEMTDLQVGVVVENSTWKGKLKPKIIDTYPAEEPADGADTADAATGALPSEEEINEMSKPELAALVDEQGWKIALTGTTAAQRKQVIAAMEEAAEVEQEVEAVEEKVKPGKKGKVKPKPKVALDTVNESDEGELGELIETYELDVDLDKHATLRRKRAAVVDALEEAEMLEETPF